MRRTLAAFAPILALAGCGTPSLPPAAVPATSPTVPVALYRAEPDKTTTIAQPTRVNVTVPATPPEWKRSVVPAVVLVTLAAAGIGAGTGFLVVSRKDESAAAALKAFYIAPNPVCNPYFCQPALAQLKLDMNAYGKFGDAALGAFVAGGVAVAGAGLYLLWPPRAQSESNAGPVLALSALAGAGIGTGIAFQVLSSWNKSSAATLTATIASRYGSCIPSVASYDVACPQLQSKVNAYVTQGDIAVASFVAGGAAAASAALYLLWPSPRTKTPGPSVARDIRLTPTGNGLLVSGRF